MLTLVRPVQFKHQVINVTALTFTVFAAGSWQALTVVLATLQFLALCSIFAWIWMTRMGYFLTKKKKKEKLFALLIRYA